MINIWIDEEMIYGINGPSPYQFEIDTRMLSEGLHTIAIGVHPVDPPDIGLLSLAMVPPLLYTVDIEVDHSPPTPVLLQSVEWDDMSKAPKLTWQKNTDQNFYQYYIQREGGGAISYSEPIFDQEQTTFTDAFFEEVIGINCRYRIMVFNRDQTVASNEVVFSYPESFPDTYDYNVGIRRPIFNPVTNELLVLHPQGVRAYNLNNPDQVRIYPMENKYPQAFALNHDGTRLCIGSTYSPKLIVMDAISFEVIASADVDFNIAI